MNRLKDIAYVKLHISWSLRNSWCEESTWNHNMKMSIEIAPEGDHRR